MRPTISKAVIPAAGMGKRLRPLTNVIPKELLPLGLRPMIAHCLEEAATCGVEQVCVVIRREKEALRRYIDAHASSTRLNVTFCYQDRPKGIADAVHRAEGFVDGSWFCILVPDLVFVGPRPALAQILEAWGREPVHMVGLYRLRKGDLAHIDLFGLNEREEMTPGAFRVTYLHEKSPELRDRFREGSLIVTPPYVMSPAYFDHIAKARKEACPEVDDGPVLRALMRQTRVMGVQLTGRLYDAGNPAGFASASQAFAAAWLARAGGRRGTGK